VTICPTGGTRTRWLDALVETALSTAEQAPRTRADCVDGPRPCPWAACRYHAALVVDADGAIRLDTGRTGTPGRKPGWPRKWSDTPTEFARLLDTARAVLDGRPTCLLDDLDRPRG
jgi:hypothetical protein